MATKTREVTPIIRFIRDFLNQRKLVNHARYEGMVSARSGPEPQLPKGECHKMADNDYFSRDGRRESQPATIVYEQGPKQIEGGAEGTTSAAVKVPRPGVIYNWDM